MQQLKSRIEAVLFVTAKALTLEEIATYLDKEPEEVEQALLDLIMDYASRDGALAVLRTLLVIALKEPIRQTELVKLRSAAYEHVAELVEKGLVSKHKDKNGRSINIKTTPKFAEYFKLKGDTRALAQKLEQDLAEKKNNA